MKMLIIFRIARFNQILIILFNYSSNKRIYWNNSGLFLIFTTTEEEEISGFATFYYRPLEIGETLQEISRLCLESGYVDYADVSRTNFRIVVCLVSTLPLEIFCSLHSYIFSVD